MTFLLSAHSTDKVQRWQLKSPLFHSLKEKTLNILECTTLKCLQMSHMIIFMVVGFGLTGERASCGGFGMFALLEQAVKEVYPLEIIHIHV